MIEPWTTDARDAIDGATGSEHETIALLQEEIARLEVELRLRDEAAERQHTPGAGSGRQEQDESFERRLAELTRELSAREETIALLMEQIRLAEEAEAASRAEWDQLQRWIAEVERRVSEQKPEPGARGSDLEEALEAERRSSEVLRQTVEREQRSWQAERLTLLAEVQRLRDQFGRVAGASDTTAAALHTLEQENRQLREAYHELARSGVPVREVDSLHEELQAVRDERDAFAQELRRERDDRQRERNEHEAALNALRSQLARESLRRQEEHVKAEATLPRPADDPLDPDQRIRAFREHLREIHHDESEQRMRRGLAARVSRLWHHTGPNH